LLLFLGNLFFGEIVSGISESKVFLACVSDKYGESENCRREVQLATDRKKLIIPLIVSTCSTYPPRGSMGPILAGKLYIDISDEEKLLQSCDHLLTTLQQRLRSVTRRQSIGYECMLLVMLEENFARHSPKGY